MEGVLASTALPPWFSPIEKEGHLIIDGGTLSNLPVEPAIALGATEIIALDLKEPRSTLKVDLPHKQDLEKLYFSVLRRSANLEMALAAARDIPVHHLTLRSSPPVPIWDFSKHRQLFQIGYETTCNEIAAGLSVGEDRSEVIFPDVVKDELLQL